MAILQARTNPSKFLRNKFPAFLRVKKNLNASKPSEHPPVRGENVKTFRWDHTVGCKYTTSSWHLNGFPNNGGNIDWVNSIFFMKNLNASRPFEHRVRGKIAKRLGGIMGCKYKTSSWYLNGFPDDRNIGSTVESPVLSTCHFIPIVGVGKRGAY